ncbi:MAG: aminotransferase class IV [Frankiaceae bacterium]
MRIWINGSLVDAARASVPANDNGLTVGDGVFETLKVLNGTPFALSRHLDRLAASGRALGLAVPTADELRLAVGELLTANAGELPAAARLRITVTGGPSPLSPERGGGPSTVVIGVAPLTPWPPAVDVVVVPWTRNERGALTGVKSTSYAENVRALAHAKERGGAEAIFANTVGELCEGTGSNVFLGIGGRLVTPPLASGCLAGVTRGLLLEWTDAIEEPLPLEALGRADEVFLASTTREVLPVRAVDGRPLAAAPGPLTALAARTYAERAAADADP